MMYEGFCSGLYEEGSTINAADYSCSCLPVHFNRMDVRELRYISVSRLDILGSTC